MLHVLQNVPITFQWVTKVDGNSMRHGCDKASPLGELFSTRHRPLAGAE
jgi:hypothetical protein